MAAAPPAKPSAVCLLTGTTEHVSPLVVNHSTTDTHMHTVQLMPDTDGCMLKSIHTPAATLAHMYGCAPGAVDLLGFQGIKIHGATTTHMAPVGITFTSRNMEDPDQFVPLQTLTRSCFQRQVHSDASFADDAGQLCHYIANPASVGFVHPPVEMKLHEDQCADNMATNLCLRQMRWPNMTMDPKTPYPTVHSDEHGEMTAVPMSAPAQCNVSHLFQTNESEIKKIGGSSAKLVETTSGKFAMVQTSALKAIKEKLSASFKTKSLFNGGLSVNMFPLTGEPMNKDVVTTLTYSLMKHPETIAARTAAAMDGSTSSSHIERIHHANIAAFLGEADGPAAAMTAVSAPTQTELAAELTSLVNA